MTTLLIIKTGSTFPEIVDHIGDFEHWVLAGVSCPLVDCLVVDVFAGMPLPLAESFAGIIVTGSHAMVTDNLPWSVALERWLADAVAKGVPILGICYGHQLLAKALGGVVGFNPNGPEIGCFDINITQAASQDVLFSPLPKTFKAHLTHHQSIGALPVGAVTLACNLHEPHQAFRVGRCAWGVQFHPEYSKTVMVEYMWQQKDIVSMGSQVFEDQLAQVVETPVARNLLQSFAEYCVNPI